MMKSPERAHMGLRRRLIDVKEKGHRQGDPGSPIKHRREFSARPAICLMREFFRQLELFHPIVLDLLAQRALSAFKLRKFVLDDLHELLARAGCTLGRTRHGALHLSISAAKE